MAQTPDTDRQVDDNYDDFVKTHLPDLIVTHEGEWALLHDREVVALFPTMSDAYRNGLNRYPDHMFSVQEVCEQTPIHMGRFARVL